jgi:plastocyanin
MVVARHVCSFLMVVSWAGCGGSGASMTTSTPSASTVTVTVGSGERTAFSPPTVSINPGDTVMWQWADGPHTVTSGAPGAVDGRFCSLAAGAPSPTSCNSTSYAQSSGTYSFMFDTAGSYPYFCEIHGSMMTGTVVVGGGGGAAGGGGTAGGGGGTGGGNGYGY